MRMDLVVSLSTWSMCRAYEGYELCYIRGWYSMMRVPEDD